MGWKNFGSLPFVDVRIDFIIDKAFQIALKFFVFVGQLHACLRGVVWLRKVSTKHLLCSVCMPIIPLSILGNTHSVGPFHDNNYQEM